MRRALLAGWCVCALLAGCTLLVDTGDLAGTSSPATDDGGRADGASSSGATLRGDEVDVSSGGPPPVEASTEASATDARHDPEDAKTPSPTCKANGETCDDNDECCSDGCKSHTCSN
ncbi:MAG: hypothetical protein U0270_30205 [Labilithrix sp.]